VRAAPWPGQGMRPTGETPEYRRKEKNACVSWDSITEEVHRVQALSSTTQRYHVDAREPSLSHCAAVPTRQHIAAMTGVLGPNQRDEVTAP